MTRCDDGTLCKWLQAATQLGHFLSPDRVQPALRLDLDQGVLKDPHPNASFRVHVYATISAEFCNANIAKTAVKQQLLHKNLKPSRFHRKQLTPNVFNLLDVV